MTELRLRRIFRTGAAAVRIAAALVAPGERLLSGVAMGSDPWGRTPANAGRDVVRDEADALVR